MPSNTLDAYIPLVSDPCTDIQLPCANRFSNRFPDEKNEAEPCNPFTANETCTGDFQAYFSEPTVTTHPIVVSPLVALTARTSLRVLFQINYIPTPPVCLDDSEYHALARTHTTERNPSTVVFKHLTAGSSITSTLLHVKYGTFNGAAAGLIVFQSDFAFIPGTASRITSAKIKVKFIQSDPSLPTKLPRIVHHQPHLQNGATSDSAIHNTLHANLTLQPPAPANVGSISAGGSKEKSFTRTHHTIVRSSVIPHSDSRIGRQCLNTVVWSLGENEAQMSGISPIFKGTVIIQLPSSTEENCSSQFYAQFRIEANKLAKFGRCASLWSKNLTTKS